MEVYFLGRGDPCGMRGFHQQAHPGDGAEPKLTWSGMFESIGVGMQLAAVEGDLGRFRFRGLEIYHAMGAIFKIDRCIDLSAEEAAQVYDRAALRAPIRSTFLKRSLPREVGKDRSQRQGDQRNGLSSSGRWLRRQKERGRPAG